MLHRRAGSGRNAAPRSRIAAARRPGLALGLLVAAVPFSSPVAAGTLTLRHTYRFDPGRLAVQEAGGRARVTAPGLPQTWERGRPELPYDVVTLLVPRGAHLVGVRAARGTERVLRAGVTLAPAEPRRTDSGAVVFPPEGRPVGKVADGSGAYPELAALAAGGGALMGYQLVGLSVYPVRVIGDRILASETLDLEVELALDGPEPLARERYSAAIEARAARMVRRLVANPEALAGYARPAGVRVESVRRGFHPTQAPSLEGSPVDYVILTSQALLPNFQVLADWKTQRGVPTVVRTVEWIQANYRNGCDLAQTLRTFIQDAYAKWGVQYVLLGGDTDILPARYGFSQFGPETEEDIPADLYFACLDGNWNADGDALWGEAAVGPTDLVDDPDLYAEVLVGRLPVSTGADADRVITKVKTYENPTTALSSYQNKALFASEVLFPVDWDGTQPFTLDGAEFSEYEMLPLASPCVSATRLYQNYTDYPGSLPLTKASTIAQMNAGYGFVNHIGHGFRYNMSCGDQSLLTNDATALTNGDRRFVLYFLNCSAAAFDYPCLAEAFLKANGGAVAVLGASRAAFALPSRNYNVGFIRALFDTVTAKNIGELFVASRLQWTPNAVYDTGDHYTHFLYNLLADPELVVHTCTLGSTNATFPSAIGLGTNAIHVGVTVNGQPRRDALVCLQKGTEEYEHGRTDAAGGVTLTFVAESAGTVLLTVSGQNMRTFVGSISVSAGSAPYIQVQSVGLDDDSVGSTSGNADGVLDAGETVALNVTFANRGGAAASGVTGVLRIASPWVTVQDSTYNVGALASGASVATTGEVRFLVAANAPDGAVLPCEFRSRDGVRTWIDTVNRVVHAPELQLVLVRVADPPPGGNGDGNIQAGETFDLRPYFKNYGTGAADEVMAFLGSGDPDILITTPFIQVGRVAPMQETSVGSTFRLQETTLDENAITLASSDSHQRTRLWRITLRGPTAPAAPVLDATQGSTIVVSAWTPSTEADLAGYHVYRSVSGSGPWTRITLDRTARVAYYRDAGLQPSTQYYYYVTAVDSSGNESPASATAHINTNPAQLAGWPIGMDAVSSCPPAVGDITGDGSKEIVAGNSTLYAWDWRGIELRDDDSDPQTWGVFAAEIATVTAAVALGDLDPAPGLEVFATVWDDGNKAFIVRGDGSFPANWPQNPDSLLGPRGYWGAPGVIDVDGDGRPELFAPSKNGNLYAWHADGTPLGATPAWKTGLGTWSRCSPAFANLDGDPETEIAYAAPNGTLYIWNPDGSNLPRFPMALGTSILSSTAIGDVNGDGVQDVVLITEDDSLYVIDSARGKRLPGWPVYISVESGNAVSPSPALADFDFDGHLEIVVANNAADPLQSAVRVYNDLGQLLPGWPQAVDGHTSESSPIVADFSGDGIPDIVFGNQGGLIYGWDKNGNALAGFPLSVGDFVRSTPFADDVDGDGDIDLVLAGYDKNLWIWDFPAPWNRQAAQWPTFKHDPQRTGYWGHREIATTDAGDTDRASRVPERAFLAQNVPNPFNPVTAIEYGVPALHGAAPVPVQLDVYDVKGRLVRRLVRGAQLPGTRRALWDGRDAHGAAVASGVFLYRLQIGGQTLQRKMLVLR